MKQPGQTLDNVDPRGRKDVLFFRLVDLAGEQLLRARWPIVRNEVRDIIQDFASPRSPRKKRR